MSRKVIGRPDNPMLVRWRLLQTPWFGVYLHLIHREDLDRLPHDHPWVFWSWVLRGAYREEFHPDARLIGAKHGHGRDVREFCSPWLALAHRWRWRRGAGWAHHFPLRSAHRIIGVKAHTTTLVLVGRKKRTWGFYDGRGFIDWREYHDSPNGWNLEQQAERARVAR